MALSVLSKPSAHLHEAALCSCRTGHWHLLATLTAAIRRLYYIPQAGKHFAVLVRYTDKRRGWHLRASFRPVVEQRQAAAPPGSVLMLMPMLT